ncbi:MAG: NAD(P)/FAD-dependent oxidoreductase [Coriobacteriales bacterium]|jgi:nitrite reductase (NADH) large subunit
MRKYSYIIVGNSAAAISAVEAIRSIDDKGTILILDREDTPAYSTPMISYLLKGKTDEGHMAIRGPRFYEENKVDCGFGKEAEAIDPKSHTITAGGEKYEYGKLLLACGSRPAEPPVEGLGGSNVFPFLNLTDAHAIEECISECRKANPDSPVRAAVIGSGLIGCKACEGLSAIVDELTMLARSPQILRSILAPEASPIAERALAKGGVDVRLSTVATAFEKDGDMVTSLTLNDGSKLECDLVILAAGVRPNAEMAVQAGAKIERGLVVDEHMQTNLPDVYAAGDIAQTHDILENRDRVIALWPNAVKQGHCAGLAMAGSDKTFDGNFPMNSITLFGQTFLSAGVKNPGEGMVCRTSLEGDNFSKFITSGDNLVGFMVVNRPLNAGIYTRLIDEKIPLGDVDPQMFSRAPQIYDLPEKIRWEKTHEVVTERRN